MHESERSDWAARLVVGLSGPGLLPEEESWLRAWRPAGVILFGRNVTGARQAADLCAGLHDAAPALEIVADHEGGAVSQLAAAVGRPPAAWALGVLDDEDLTRRVHRETALRCRDVGIDRLLAPCADVLTEPENPVIGSRAFGADAQLVARHVAAAVAGIGDGGLAGCLKHWPGHGGGLLDSHLAACRVGSGALPQPFAAGAAAGCAAIMAGHLWPAVGTGGEDLPATLDRAVTGAARAVVAGSAAGAPMVYADDVTMGALCGAITGAAPAAGAGMLDPDELDLDWFAALARGGCDRWLIRGIPWRAFPLADGRPNTAAAAAPVAAASEDDGAGQSNDVYDEARRRLRPSQDVEAFAATEELLWLDLSAGDRWQAAAGTAPEEQQRFAARLERDFRKVVRLTACAVPDGSSGPDCRRLLVTSHRPLNEQFGCPPDRLAALLATLARQGLCLAMGHPSLGDALKTRLPAAWATSCVYDVTVDDYTGASPER